MSFNAKDMTQGEQIAFMRLRMFAQIGNLIFYCRFIAFFLVAVSVMMVVFIVFIFSADIGRYQLSAFNTVLVIVNFHKHGGE